MLNAINKNKLSEDIDLTKRPLSIKCYPESVLRKNSEPVSKFDSTIKDLIIDMLQFMKENNGVGLAGPQVGFLKQIIVFDIGQESYSLINPKIIQSSGSEKMKEGCLSLPEYFVDIKRSTNIIVSAYDVNGTKKEFEFNDLLARVVQHEIDHLKGTLICDYVPVKKILGE